MTKEALRDYVDFLRSQDEISYDVYSGLIDGIDTLEQEPCEDAVSRQAVIDTIFAECSGEKLDIDFAKVLLLRRAIKALPSVTSQELIHGKCNQCKYYEGVHNAQGHAPCSYHKSGGVMWDWHCSQFESEDKEK